MKSAYLFLIVFFLVTQPLLSDAQVYKWKDKDGSIRYTDTPPPSNIKQETIGSKKAPSPSVNPAPAATPTEQVKQKPVLNDKVVDTKTVDIDAKKRQLSAETEKQNREKDAKLKIKSENCQIAKSNFETYKQGGRIHKVNEKGERVYLDDKDLEAGKLKAQNEINENCNELTLN